MTLDIGIDFTRNDGPPREVVLTDWEWRLLVHCAGLYHDAAVALDDATRPLASQTLRKLQAAPVAETASEERRKRARQRELDDLRRQLEDLGACVHPAEQVTERTRADGSPAVSRTGLVHGLCECGRRVIRDRDETTWRPVLGARIEDEVRSA